MCGIVGLIHPNINNQSSIIEKMLSEIKHRGPDGSGVFEYSGVSIGQSRLAIIDLENGHQPMADESAKYWITYNGELYNYLELKEQLRGKGFNFSTDSDTEVVIQSYACWGKECVNHFRGMFAFCILDTNRKELFLARDHFGIKPLVYTSNHEVFAFASEINVLRAIPNLNFEINPLAIDQYLSYQFIPAPNTIYKEIKKLPPAHFLRVDFEGKILELTKYWELEFIPDYTKDESYWAEALQDVIYESVKSHLVADVPFGAFLSGGVDSSIVVGNMAKILNTKVKTFSIGFEEEGFSELEYARKVSQKWGTDHYEAIVKPDGLGILPKLIKHYGEPFGDSSAVPTYYVSELARTHVPMVLSGDAGDELFAGYESYSSRWTRHLTPIPEHLLGYKKAGYAIANKLFHKKYPLRTADYSDWKKYIQYFSQLERLKLWNSDFLQDFSKTDAFHSELWTKTNSLLHFQKAQFLDFNTYLPFDILTKVDIASMMHGLEVRIPLLDIQVVNLAARIPQEININKSSGEWVGKQLLKKILAKDMGDEFAFRKKMGFGVPISKWFEETAKSRNEVKERILSSGNGLDTFFEHSALEKIANGNNSGQQWLLVFLQEWLGQNK